MERFLVMHSTTRKICSCDVHKDLSISVLCWFHTPNSYGSVRFSISLDTCVQYTGITDRYLGKIDQAIQFAILKLLSIKSIVMHCCEYMLTLVSDCFICIHQSANALFVYISQQFFCIHQSAIFFCLCPLVSIYFYNRPEKKVLLSVQLGAQNADFDVLVALL